MAIITQKARVGLKNLYFAELTTDTIASITYASPVAVPGLVKVEVNPNVNSATLYTDNKASIYYSTVGSVEVTIEKDSLPDDLLSWILGRDTEGAVNYVTNVYSAPYVAMMFEQTYDNDTSSFVKLYKGKFAEPSSSNETKGDSVNFQTGEIVGNFLSTQYKKAFGANTRSLIMSCVDEESDGYADQGATWFDAVIAAAPAFVVTCNVSESDVDVSKTAAITISSTSKFDPTWNIDSDNFHVVATGGTAIIAGALAVATDELSVSFTPTSAMAGATVHTITYNALDVYGQETGTIFVNFTTAA